MKGWAPIPTWIEWAAIIYIVIFGSAFTAMIYFLIG